ncbi:RHTO0S01e05270g1_1 [Rhodotorula toruloides]|uniref:RHTO0S01e05270g1_1 n=2 Tax=Rhodotorula toruloides TaxID=5286 RepID=A0A061ALT7_RHOTO|nr:uncharacterized protein RHTO_01453 [Rhodotorula toruloides NP11]EMS21806.1 hypothetical protein RHTO_01453 [Rhodotorula toruloides NP11]CDR35704.1 RHTO0S01e05270g1_1 [Rhodotorula toruloides]
MSNRLSYASLQSHVGALLTTGRTHFGKTSHGRDWKDGVFSAATEAWFEVLAQQDDFLARSANIRARFTRDKERVSFLGSDVTFALLAETLLGTEVYNQAISGGNEKDDPWHLGGAYGAVLVDAGTGCTLQQLTRELAGMRNLAGVDGVKRYAATLQALTHAWPYLSSRRRHVV